MEDTSSRTVFPFFIEDFCCLRSIRIELYDSFEIGINLSFVMSDLVLG